MRRRTLLASSIIALLAAGCTPTGAPQGGGAPSGVTVEAQQGPAPSSTVADLSVRADQSVRTGDAVAVALSVATNAAETDLTGDDLQVTTNNGVEVPVTMQQVTLNPDSVATARLNVPLPNVDVNRLDVVVRSRSGKEAKVAVPVPAAGKALAWQPAPVRQVAVPQAVTRTGDADLVVDTVRSEGLITEVSYHSSGLGGYAPQTGSTGAVRDGVTLTESGGTVHPLIGQSSESSVKDGRRRGTLRFLGEIGADTTNLTLAANPGGWTKTADPISITLPSHADSPVEPAAGTLARSVAKPVTLRSAGGATWAVEKIDVMPEYIAVQGTVKAGSRELSVATSDVVKPSVLVEPDGFAHAITTPAGVDLNLKPGESGKLTLVFQGATKPDVTALQVKLGYESVVAVNSITGTLTIPAADKANPPTDGITFGQLNEQPPTPAITVTPAPASQPQATDSAAPTTFPTPSTEFSVRDIVPLPGTTNVDLGAVRSTGQGTTLPQVASAAEVDAGADEKAQKSLQDLGAKKTPDGWVVTLPETVLFDYNKADVLPNADAKLTAVADVLKYYDQAKIGVQGHTDSTGDAAHNQELSQQRAQAVADNLAAKGIAVGRMKVSGFGATKPVASNGTEDGKAKNRRVEVVLTDNA
ncbi:OmpA family protein [Nigerium massiliense]|uniref:OmpA family protein n=1 Tax=Nigerium massiliense TaxID=1522317 RepID=UPI0006946F24|nr:OmpA family protein [Nigerium massiliense]